VFHPIPKIIDVRVFRRSIKPNVYSLNVSHGPNSTIVPVPLALFRLGLLMCVVLMMQQDGTLTVTILVDQLDQLYPCSSSGWMNDQMAFTSSRSI
jgi:hypothetical protein